MVASLVALAGAAMNERLIDAVFEVGHPERLRILRACAEEPQSPKTLRNGHNLSRVSYHFRILRDKGLLEISEERPVRGGLQRFHVLTHKGTRLLDLLEGQGPAL